MDIFSEPLTDSETIGTPPPESEGASSIGLRPGGTGYAKTPTTLAEVARRLPETHKQARKARAAEAKARSSETCEVPALRQSTDFATMDLRAVAGPDFRPPARMVCPRVVSLHGWLPPPALNEAQRAALPTAIAKTRDVEGPAGATKTITLLVQLSTVVRVPDQDNMKLMLQTYAEDLSCYPFAKLEKACRTWRRKSPFFPAICELIELLGPVPLAGEQWLWRLLVLRSVANNPAPDGLVTREWLHDRERDARHDVDALVRA